LLQYCAGHGQTTTSQVPCCKRKERQVVLITWYDRYKTRKFLAAERIALLKKG
jgi:hypothetical protein